MDDKDSQKRRKKSQESSAGHVDAMDDEQLELFHVVQEDLCHKSTVGWQNAVKVLNSAYQHLERPESQAFLDDAFSKIISIMLDQQYVLTIACVAGPSADQSCYGFIACCSCCCCCCFCTAT